jgi:surface protein
MENSPMVYQSRCLGIHVSPIGEIRLRLCFFWVLLLLCIGCNSSKVSNEDGGHTATDTVADTEDETASTLQADTATDTGADTEDGTASTCETDTATDTDTDTEDGTAATWETDTIPDTHSVASTDSETDTISVSTGPFISVWQTDIDGASAENQIQLPLVETGVYDFVVRWGDGAVDTITEWNAPETTHTYNKPGEYVVEIYGAISGWRFLVENESGDNCVYDSLIFPHCGDSSKLLDIRQWGTFAFGSNTAQFYECRNLVVTAEDAPDLSATTSLEEAFFGGNELTFNHAGLRLWDTSSITSMRNMFKNTMEFNGDVSTWDTSRVTDMHGVFNTAISFNRDIGAWDTSKVIDMNGMFENAWVFNQNIGNWDTSKVTDMERMFSWAAEFNQDICNWNTASVTSMSDMFREATKFNQDISRWDVSAVVNMDDMFRDATSFDRNLGTWQITSLTGMKYMFSGIRLSTANYDALLIGWASQTVQMNCEFGAGDATYSAAAADARRILTEEYLWEICDGGMAVK